MRLLAGYFAKKIEKPFFPILKAPFRFKQAKLSKEQRLQKKFGNFEIKSKMILPKRMLLIDDVISTGATANACAQVLKAQGVEKVYGLFIASNRNTHV